MNELNKCEIQEVNGGLVILSALAIGASIGCAIAVLKAR